MHVIQTQYADLSAGCQDFSAPTGRVDLSADPACRTDLAAGPARTYIHIYIYIYIYICMHVIQTQYADLSAGCQDFSAPTGRVDLSADPACRTDLAAGPARMFGRSTSVAG